MQYVEKNGDITCEVIEGFLDGSSDALRPDQGIDFIQFAKQRFIDRYNSGKIGVSSRENGISYMNQFAKFLKQEQRGSHGVNNELLYLGEITEQLVLDFRNWQLGNERKVDTVNKVVQAIAGVCTYASQMRYVPIEVTLAIRDLHLSDKSLDADEVRVKYLTEEQLKEFVGIRETLPHIRMKEFHDMFMFSFYACGLRLIDMMTLRWVDIDLKKQVIRKIQVKTRNRNVIPIREAAIEILDRWKGRYKVFVFGLLPDKFNLNVDEELRRRRNSVTNTINTSLKRQSKFANFEFEITFHWARHTWAVLALEKGVEISKISRLLGHVSSAVTEKVYCRFLPDTLGEVVDELDFKF
jgi:integrase